MEMTNRNEPPETISIRTSVTWRLLRRCYRLMTRK